MRNKALFIIVFAILTSGSTRFGDTFQTNGMGSAQAPSVPTVFSSPGGWTGISGNAAALLFVAGSSENAELIQQAGRITARLVSISKNAFYRVVGFIGETKSSPSIGIISIGGHVINASGGVIPQNTFLTLTIYETNQIVSQIKIPLNSLGVFKFDLVPWNPNFTYRASVVYNNIEFDSDLIDGGMLASGAAVQVQLVIYEASTNTQLLEGIRMRVIYDFTNPGWVRVVESILISNPTSLVIVAPADGSPILAFPLPKEATNVVFPDGNGTSRFRLTGDGFGDWQPVMPGDGHQVLVEYSVPFTSSWRCDLSTPIAIDSLMVMVKAPRIVTSSTGMQLSLMQRDSTGSISVYATSGIQADDSISILFSTQDQIQRIWLGIGIFTLTLFFALGWLVWSNQQSKSAGSKAAVAGNDENVDTILDAIIALDDRYKHGDIGEESFHRARAEYIDKLEAIRDQTKE